MGFIEAFTGSLGGTFADQWKDFYTVPDMVSPTAGVCPAIQHQTDAGRGSNIKHSENIITNGSKILVPEGFALITFENGEITGFVADPGGYIYTNDTSVHAQSFFAGGGLIESVIKNSWERFKYGGIPGDQQLAFYVNLKEIADNKFGTQAPIYWDDAYIGAQVGAVTRGSYTLKLTDPILFVKGYVPAQHLIQNATPFDFADINNPAVEQLFTEVVGSLTAAFSGYANDPSRGGRITGIQNDSAGFAMSLGAAVETNYKWTTDRGLTIIKAALLAIEYDEATRKLFEDVAKADALSGSRGNSFLQQSVARGIEAAGSGENGAIGLGMMGMGIGASTGVAGGIQQPNTPPAGNPFVAQQQAAAAAATQAAAPAAAVVGAAAPTAAPAATGATAAPAVDGYDELTKLKGLLDSGVITQADFDAKKAQILGL